MKTERQAQVRGRALILSAGGPLGAAWEIGFAAGLESAGAPLLGADRVIGTSVSFRQSCVIWPDAYFLPAGLTLRNSLSHL